jgi:sRNA-binding carbon storage regulator CsrA
VPLVITVPDQQEFRLSRDGVEIGRIQVSIRGDGRARVAFDFPRDLEIWRGEVADEIARNGRRGTDGK